MPSACSLCSLCVDQAEFKCPNITFLSSEVTWWRLERIRTTNHCVMHQVLDLLEFSLTISVSIIFKCLLWAFHRTDGQMVHPKLYATVWHTCIEHYLCSYQKKKHCWHLSTQNHPNFLLVDTKQPQHCDITAIWCSPMLLANVALAKVYFGLGVMKGYLSC